MLTDKAGSIVSPAAIQTCCAINEKWRPIMGKKVLVLGATGAMGQYLIPYLAEAGHTVDAVSLDETKSAWPNVKYITANAKDTHLDVAQHLVCPFFRFRFDAEHLVIFFPVDVQFHFDVRASRAQDHAAGEGRI